MLDFTILVMDYAALFQSHGLLSAFDQKIKDNNLPARKIARTSSGWVKSPVLDANSAIPKAIPPAMIVPMARLKPLLRDAPISSCKKGEGHL